MTLFFVPSLHSGLLHDGSPVEPGMTVVAVLLLIDANGKTCMVRSSPITIRQPGAVPLNHGEAPYSLSVNLLDQVYPVSEPVLYQVASDGSEPSCVIIPQNVQYDVSGVVADTAYQFRSTENVVTVPAAVAFRRTTTPTSWTTTPAYPPLSAWFSENFESDSETVSRMPLGDVGGETVTLSVSPNTLSVFNGPTPAAVGYVCQLSVITHGAPTDQVVTLTPKTLDATVDYGGLTVDFGQQKISVMTTANGYTDLTTVPADLASCTGVEIRVAEQKTVYSVYGPDGDEIETMDRNIPNSLNGMIAACNVVDSSSVVGVHRLTSFGFH